MGAIAIRRGGLQPVHAVSADAARRKGVSAAGREGRWRRSKGYSGAARCGRRCYRWQHLNGGVGLWGESAGLTAREEEGLRRGDRLCANSSHSYSHMSLFVAASDLLSPILTISDDVYNNFM